MTNQSESRLDRIEQALENERIVVADLRASVEVLKLTADSQNAAMSELKLSVNALLEVAQIHQQDM
jgi:hypothetical protein